VLVEGKLHRKCFQCSNCRASLHSSYACAAGKLYCVHHTPNTTATATQTKRDPPKQTEKSTSTKQPETRAIPRQSPETLSKLNPESQSVKPPIPIPKPIPSVPNTNGPSRSNNTNQPQPTVVVATGLTNFFSPIAPNLRKTNLETLCKTLNEEGFDSTQDLFKHPLSESNLTGLGLKLMDVKIIVEFIETSKKNAVNSSSFVKPNTDQATSNSSSTPTTTADPWRPTSTKTNMSNLSNPRGPTHSSEKESVTNQGKYKGHRNAWKLKQVNCLTFGETGSGKTTLLNCANFMATGKSLESKELEALIGTKFLPGILQDSETNRANVTESQTSTSKLYQIPIETGEDDPDNLIVNILDTPGFGDTGESIGIDEANAKNICDTVAKTPALNAIFVVINGSNEKKTERAKWIASNISKNLPKAFAEKNVFFIFTHQNPNFYEPPKEIFELFGFPKQPKERIFIFENNIFNYDPHKHDLSILGENWEKTKLNLRKLFVAAYKCEPVETKDFGIIQSKKTKLTAYIMQLQDKTKCFAENTSRLVALKVKFLNLCHIF
jgi:energy-coupling factor transporter ATP-binding protein EcfA2